MDYSCPNCGIDLSKRIIPTKWTGEGDRRVFWYRVPRVASCPECGQLLQYAHQAEDQKILRCIYWSVIAGVAALFSDSLLVRFFTVAAFFIAIAYVAFRITRRRYRGKPIYAKYDEGPVLAKRHKDHLVVRCVEAPIRTNQD